MADAAPCLMFRLENLTICGIDPNAIATSTNVVSIDEVVQGRGQYLESTNANEVMLDKVFAEVNNLKVGDTFTDFNNNLTVIRIVDPGLHSKPVGIANIYASLGKVQDIARYYGDVYGFAVKDSNLVLVKISAEGNSSYISAVQKSVLNTVESYGGQPGAVVGYKCGFIAREVISINETGAWAISLVLLICVVLFSLKSQFSSVAERTREIGILKAIGWTDGDITKQIFLESLFQGVTGGIIGVVIGSVAILLIPQLIVPNQNLQLTIPFILIVLGLFASTIGGAIAGIVPAYRATKLQPAEALRHF